MPGTDVIVGDAETARQLGSQCTDVDGQRVS